MVTFSAQKVMNGYHVTMIINKPNYDTYKYGEAIIKYLQVDTNDFNKALKLYNGIPYFLGSTLDSVILYFITKESANDFINNYLEPQLIAKELS